MTVILKSVAFWVPVTFARVGDDGKPEVLKFRARFRRLKKSERLALDHRIAVSGLLPDVRKMLQEKIDNPETEADTRDFLRERLAAKPTNDAEVLNDLLADWDLKDHQGEYVPYTHTTRTELEEDLDGLEGCLVKAYMEATGKPVTAEDVEKNSEAQSVTTS